MSFQTPVDIANRGLQILGQQRIVAFTDDTKQASEMNFVYDKIRRVELARNNWRFAIRNTALRPLTPNMKLAAFGGWDNAASYAQNDVVTSLVDGHVYVASAANTNLEPSANPSSWGLYFGPDMVNQFITSWINTFTYEKGDQTVGSNGTGYVSLSAQSGYDPTTDGGVHWAVDTTIVNISYNSTAAAYTAGNAYGQIANFYAGELVHVGDVTYISLLNNNQDIPVASGVTSWQALTTLPTLAVLTLIYPIGAGPLNDESTMNVFRLPVGYLKKAPQNPKAGQAIFLGAPDGDDFDDWVFQDNYFTSWSFGSIIFRFVADIAYVPAMQDMFCEGLAARCAAETCEILTQSDSKIKVAEGIYNQQMGEARRSNFIDTDPVYPPEDSYITCRY